MFGSLERQLSRLFAARDGVGPDHRRSLEAELLEGFDRRHPATVRHSMKLLSTRNILAATAAGLVLGVVACNAPVEVSVPVGRSLDVDLDVAPSGDAPDPRAVVDAIRGSGEVEDVSVRVMRHEGHVSMHFDLWGSNLPEGPLGDRVRAAVPALEKATFTERPVEGTVRSTVGAKLGHDLFDLKLGEVDVESARRAVMDRLAAQGDADSKVDVEKFEGPNGEKGMRIRVEKRVGPDGATIPEGPVPHEEAPQH